MCPLYISMHLISNKSGCLGLSFLSYLRSSHLFKQCIALWKKKKSKNQKTPYPYVLNEILATPENIFSGHRDFFCYLFMIIVYHR